MLVCLISCDTGIAPLHQLYPTISTSDYDDVDVQFVTFDRVRVTHKNGSDLKSSEIVEIALGKKDSSGFHELFSTGSYDPQSKIAYFHFDFSPILDSTAIETPLTIRYSLHDSSIIDYDFVVRQYQFPYKNTQVLITDSVMGGYSYFQDIARIGNKFYFHELGAGGLREYDLTTQTTKTLLQYPGGDHIAADSIFVFCDIGHHSVARYNLLTKSIDLWLPPFPEGSLAGLDTYDKLLYVLVRVPTTSLKTYTYDGVQLDSIALPSPGYYMTISNNILYSVQGGPSDQLGRFDLQTRTVLPNLKAPARHNDGIKAYQGLLYFCNYEKKLVGYVALSDLEEVSLDK